MGDIAQLPVNYDRCRSTNVLFVSMGDIAQLPVNVENYDCSKCDWFQWATLPNSLSTLSTLCQRTKVRFNGRHCPTPCQPYLGGITVCSRVSMGDIAQLPVNIPRQCKCSRSQFQWATLPNSLSTMILILQRRVSVSMGDIAQLPVNAGNHGA